MWKGRRVGGDEYNKYQTGNYHSAKLRKEETDYQLY